MQAGVDCICVQIVPQIHAKAHSRQVQSIQLNICALVGRICSPFIFRKPTDFESKEITMRVSCIMTIWAAWPSGAVVLLPVWISSLFLLGKFSEINDLPLRRHMCRVHRDSPHATDSTGSSTVAGLGSRSWLVAKCQLVISCFWNQQELMSANI